MLQTQTRAHTERVDDPERAAVEATPAGMPAAPATGRELFFQRCRWCGTPDYRRPFCRACGSVAFAPERSAGVGVVVRRNGNAQHNTWFVAMDEGFNLLCQVVGTVPAVVAVGVRVTVVLAVGPVGRGLPTVELTHPDQPSKHWW
ncbi:zinc ribbon domain-containing protein [Streptomyces sp. NPDC094038]|uniref:zinc ribbon domain-containing protein n=1 Tax=Streptomyces sp. NPDC094038 TaxID=3366055 RepID=UPI00380F6EAB